MSAEDWSVVTVSHNSSHHLRKWIENLGIGPFRWIVVDNASQDSSVEVATDLGATVATLSRNVGFARANNMGLEQVTTRYVAFVNPDVMMTGADSFARLEETVADGNTLVAPQLLNADGTEQPNGRGLPFLVDKFAHRGVHLPGARVHDYLPAAAGTGPYPVYWAIGAAIAGEVSVVRRIGAWNAKYFLYYEDHELGLRARTRGVATMIDPRVRWLHEWQRETTRPALRPWAHEIRSACRFYSTFPSLLICTSRQRDRLAKRWSLGR